MNVGDKIKDIEDGDCFYYGTITKITNEDTFYLLEGVIWDGEKCVDFEDIGKEIPLKWWKLELYED